MGRHVQRTKMPPPANLERSAGRGEVKVLLDDVGEQAEEARALDGLGQLALLLGGNRRDARGNDLAALGDVAREQTRVLVIDLRRVRAREGAGLATAEEGATGC